ncbi:MAG: helix-turn-helix domain-containing protein [Reichenbachiella sp.]
MQQVFENNDENRFFGLTDFTCADSNQLINEQGLYRVIWLKRGEVAVEVDGLKVSMTENQVLFLTPHHTLKVVDLSPDVVTFSFNREFYCISDHDKEVSCHGYLFYGSSELPIVDLDDKEQRSFELLQQVFLEEFETKDHIQGEMLEMLLKRLLIKSTRLVDKKTSSPAISTTKLDLVRQYHVMVEMHFREKHSVAQYADLLFKSPKTLSNVFKEYNDISPLQVIHERIMLEARRLVLLTDKTNKEIAFELGYDNAAHFSKFFTKNEGVNPSLFRKSHIRE